MSHKLLKADGSIVDLSASELAKVILVDASDPDAALQQLAALSSNDTSLLEMSSSADGRALSVISHLIASGSPEAPALWLGGDLLPDYVSLAFQCGADAVVVSEDSWTARGETGWINALKPPVTRLYRSEVWSGVTSISSARAMRELH